MMTQAEVTKLFAERGTSLVRLLRWLGLPKQGIDAGTAQKVIWEIAEELAAGNRWWRDALMFDENLRKVKARGVLPEKFWFEQYVLERCRMELEDAIFGSGNASLDMLRLNEAMAEFNALQRELIGLLAPICRFFSIPPYMKRAWKWITLRS